MHWLMMCVTGIFLAAVAKETETPTTWFPVTEELRFDFGHVGIDYTIYHDYPYENRTGDTVRVEEIDVTCDCSSVYARNTVIPPGDTTYFMLKFSTKDFYGKVTKTFTVHTDHPRLPEMIYVYSGIVGQWYGGIKPEPHSLFFLPGKGPQTIRIQNPLYDQIMVTQYIQRDSTFTTHIKSETAPKGEDLEIEIAPNPNLASGSYVSNVTLHVTQVEVDEPNILTIPIKIVVY